MLSNDLITTKTLRGATSSQRDEVKRLMQTDLYFLVNNVLRHRNRPPLIPRVHLGICDALVHPDPTKGFAEWHPVKRRVVMSSRGTLKTIIEMGHLVQMILCFPDIRILVLSGKMSLAQSIMQGAWRHFVGNEVIQELFPEFCDGVDSAIGGEEFTTPARREYDLRQPTVQIATFDSAKAGWHGELIVLDDCTNEVNCSTPEMIEKTISKYDDLDPLPEPGGYYEITCTPYGDNDLPFIVRDRGESYEAESGVKTVSFFFQPVWTLKVSENPAVQKEREERSKNLSLLKEDVDLLWPEKLNWEFLAPLYRSNPQKFAMQYLLNPGLVVAKNFTHEFLLQHTRPLSEQPLPHKSWAFINWDLSGYSGLGDFSVGIMGVWEAPEKDGEFGRLFALDAIMTKFTSSTEAATAIVDFYAKYLPVACRIENANGAFGLNDEIMRIAKARHLNILIDWQVPENKKEAKANRINELKSGMQADKVLMCSCLPNHFLQTLYNQLERFNGKTGSGKKDDCADCFAQLWTAYRHHVHKIVLSTLQPSDNIFVPELPPMEEEEAVDSLQDDLENVDLAWLNAQTMEHSEPASDLQQPNFTPNVPGLNPNFGPRG